MLWGNTPNLAMGGTMPVRWLRYSTAVLGATLLTVLCFIRPTLALPLAAILAVCILTGLLVRGVARRRERRPSWTNAQSAAADSETVAPRPIRSFLRPKSRLLLLPLVVLGALGLGLALSALIFGLIMVLIMRPPVDLLRLPQEVEMPRLESARPAPPPPPSPPVVTASYDVRANLKDTSWEIVDTVTLNNDSMAYVAERWSQLEKQSWGENLLWLLENSSEGQEVQVELEDKFPGIWRTLDDPDAQRTISMELERTPAGPTILNLLNDLLERIDCIGVAQGSLVNDVTTEFDSQTWIKVTDVPLKFSHSRLVKAESPSGFNGTTEDVIQLLPLPTSSCMRLSISAAESQLEIVTPPYVLEGTDPPTDPIADAHWVVGLDAEDALHDGVQVRILHPFLRNYAGVNIARLSWSGLFAFLFTSGIAFLVEETLFGWLLRRLPETIPSRVTRFYRAVARRPR
jgi:hypothetical protein